METSQEATAVGVHLMHAVSMAGARQHAAAAAALEPGRMPGQVWNGVGALTATCLMALIDELDVGLLVCRADGTLVHANAAGWRELDRKEAIALKPQDVVVATLVEQHSALRQAMDAAVRGRRQLVALHRPTARLMVAVQPLPALPGEAGRVLLILGRRRAATALMVEMLCRRQGVTAAEQRVLEGLLQGLSAQELARQFDVELSTVRTQVSSLRAKLGVKRIDDALLLVAELPPMASALRHACVRDPGVEAVAA